jgi:isoamylase
MRHPHVLQLIMDSLHYWAGDMHVDGFRFDLAASLARQFHEVDRLSAFFDLIHCDPVVSQLKLIAEPWDLGEGGYQVGNFPPLWSEWNGRYRDSVRDFWRGTDQTLGEFAYRLTGSSDLYEGTGRRPYASVNFVTAHDGFTLADLVSYNTKHNEANLESGRDGTDDNRSWNCGSEGATDDPQVLALRERQQRNFLATLLLSPKGYRCCSGAMSWAALSMATTTPTVRTILSRGTTGTPSTSNCSSSPARLCGCAESIRFFTAAGSFRAARSAAAN